MNPLLGILSEHADRAAVEWLVRGLPRAGGAFQRSVFFGCYAGAGRRFPGVPAWTDADAAQMRAVGIVEPCVWSLEDVARAALLLAAIEVAPAEEHVALAREAFQRGDNAERIALLRTLPLLPEPRRFVEVAVEACRTHVQDVFEAIACENPFPHQHMSDASFNQLVLKALFTGVVLDRILGWRDRNNAELRRMVTDYAAERRAAGRVVPDGVALIATQRGTEAVS